MQDAQLEKLEKDKEDSLAQYRPIVPTVRQGSGKQLEPDDVDMAEIQPVDPDAPMTEETPLPTEDDR